MTSSQGTPLPPPTPPRLLSVRIDASHPPVMSLLQNVNGILLRDLWPNGLGKSKNDTTKTEQMSEWQIMPSTYIDLTFWADVIVDHEVHKVLGPNGPRTPYALLWSSTLFPVNPPPPPRRALIRLHGFLASYCIRPLGTWNGKQDDVKTAAQFVTLESKGINEAFEPQIDALHTLTTVIHKSINDRSEPTRDVRATLNLRRRVFTRINLTADTSYPSVALPPSDQVAMRSIEHEWRVGHRLSLGMQREDGSVCRAKELVFARGDFVEVSVYADVVVFIDTKTKQRRIDVQYAPQEIIKLWSAKDARAKLAVHTSVLAPTVPLNVVPIQSMTTAYNLDGTGDKDESMGSTT